MNAPTQTTDAHAVVVDGRADGLYLFGYKPDALRFADAVRTAGGTCSVDTLPLCDRSITDELIAQELTA